MTQHVKDADGRYLDISAVVQIALDNNQIVTGRSGQVTVYFAHRQHTGTVYVAEGTMVFAPIARERPLWTPHDYRPGAPRHNASVFADVWHRDVYGIDDEGLFEAGEGSAGTLRFRAVVEAIMRSDTHGKLTLEDAENSAAMLYHLTPDVQND